MSTPKHGQRRSAAAAPPGRIHVIGGRLRGSRLSVPTLPGLRPTPQRLRQTLFDWLAPVIHGASVLDAFAGSGALGIEALSRGAACATFFERDPDQARAIAADLVRLHQETGQVVATDALVALARPASRRHDLVLLDPPFDAGAWTPAAALLETRGWLADAAWIYVETGIGVQWEPPLRWRLHRERDVGAVHGALFHAGPG